MEITLRQELKDTCLYMHIRKSDGRIFYIGIGDKYRPTEKNGRNKYWRNTVNRHDYDVIILAENLTWKRACELEILMIAFYGRKNPNPKNLNYGCLCNMTDGGEGGKGRIKTVEERRKISERTKGRKVSEKEKIKMSERAKKLGLKPPSRQGYKHSEEAIEKISKSGTGRRATEKTRKNMSRAQKGRKVSEQAKENMSKAQKAIGNKPPTQWGKKHNSKIVLDMSTGIFYDNGAEVAELYNINKMTFSNWLNGKRTNKTSFRYV